MSSPVNIGYPELSELLAAWKEPAERGVSAALDWLPALRRMPDALPPMLTPEAIADHAVWCGLEPEVAGELASLADRCWRDRYLRCWLWYCLYQLNRNDSTQNFQSVPELTQALRQDAGRFYLLVALTIVPAAVVNYRNDGIADDLIRHTLREIRCFCDNYRTSHDGLSGLLLPQLNWLRFYRAAKIYRLGRLEFKLGSARDFGLLLERRADGVKVALAAAQRFDRSGQIEFPDAPDEHPLITTLTETADQITGYPIHPTGHVLPHPQTFPLRDWQILARPGDPVADMHIPSGGGLTPEACLASFRLAADFFARRHPETGVKLIGSESWIFNPLWQQRIPDSNLAAFQRELYLLPTVSSGNDGLFFVFCTTSADYARLPRRTTLQRLMLDTVSGGDKLRSAGIFFALSDLDRYGSQYYERQFPISE